MGFRCAGSDLDARMVDGAAQNLAHYAFRAEALVAADVAATPQAMREAGVGPADAVVSDLPYGRSASTGREARRALYARSSSVWPLLVRPGGRIVLGVPEAADADTVGGDLGLEASFRVRVHRSLTRHFLVFRRPA
jgi:tRNA (guanine10-N2)-dimethyltransferase